MDPNTYTLKEVVENNFNEMREHLSDIKAQTTKTNGRVNSLEESRSKIWGAIAILMVCGGVIISLSIFAINSKIEKGIANGFEKEFNQRFKTFQTQIINN